MKLQIDIWNVLNLCMNKIWRRLNCINRRWLFIIEVVVEYLALCLCFQIVSCYLKMLNLCYTPLSFRLWCRSLVHVLLFVDLTSSQTNGFSLFTFIIFFIHILLEISRGTCFKLFLYNTHIILQVVFLRNQCLLYRHILEVYPEFLFL